ncbi:uncharacterized protein TNCV_1349251 [Trichonephila clavipes]|nr:uncharacterized protein TNCV_1349251 [Trichonephila clavipes]
MNLEVNRDDVHELLDSHYQDPTIDELIEIHEQDIEELQSLDTVQSEDQLTISSYLDSDENISSNESDGEESEESADTIDNISVNPDIYVARDGTKWIPHNSNVPDRFVTRNVLRQSSGPTSFTKHNVNVSFLGYKWP